MNYNKLRNIAIVLCALSLFLVLYNLWLSLIPVFLVFVILYSQYNNIYKPFCTGCDQIQIETSYRCLKINGGCYFYDCKTKIYCKRTNRIIAKGKNKELILDRPIWCPLRREK